MANSVKLTLPIEVPLEEGETELAPLEQTLDTIDIYKRVDAETITLLGSVPLGTATFSDPDGVINDEYHIVWRSSSSGVQSLPSKIYRALNPYKQRDEAVVVVLELQTSSVIPTVDYVAIYRRKYGETAATRIGLVPIGQQFFQDPDGEPGDIYHTTFIDSINDAESQPSDYVVSDANTGLVVVSGRFETPSGDSCEAHPDERDDVEIMLVVPDGVIIQPTAQGQVFGTDVVSAPLDENGIFSIPLVPNNLILPNNTYYLFTYRSQRIYKRIDSDNGSAQNLALLADVQPRYSRS